jgi:endonuclease-3 related protein
MKPKDLPALYEKLKEHYGDLKWWPGGSAYEIIAGAVLTQNCAWSNVEKAIGNFGGRLSPQFVLSAELDTLGEIIRPAGFFTRKAAYLKAVTEWFGKYDFSAEKIAGKNLPEIRTELLAVTGIGRETADSILLYAANIPTFVIDAYTKRLCSRFPISPETDYEKLKLIFEANLPKDVYLYNNFHAAIVNLCKDFCRKKPLCGGCPLSGDCEKQF